MRTLEAVDEFRREAGQALFTKQQAVAVTMNLLDTERKNPDKLAKNERNGDKSAR